MKLYPTIDGVSGISVAGYDTFQPLADGSFDVPDEVGDELLTFHVGGVKLYENEPERAARLEAEELERRRDPASLYDTVQSLVASRDASKDDAELEALRAERDALAAEKEALLADKAALEAEAAKVPAPSEPPADETTTGETSEVKPAEEPKPKAPRKAAAK